MLTLFAIIAIAVLVVGVAKTEGAKPVVLVMIGLLCVVLGSRATVIITNDSIDTAPANRLMAQEPPSPDTHTETDTKTTDTKTTDTKTTDTKTTDTKTTDTKATDAEITDAEITDADDGSLVLDASDSRVSDAPLSSLDFTFLDESASDPATEETPDATPDTTTDEVRYITHVEYLTENRPEWVETEPQMDGDTHYIAVKGGPYQDGEKCRRDLDAEILRVMKQYVDDYIGTKRASALIPYSLEEIKSRLVADDPFEEKLATSVGVMRQVHTRLQIHPEFRAELDERWARVRAGSRLLQTGMGAGIVFLLIGVLFSYFRLDTATRGYFTGRLQFAASAAILALVAASVLLAKWIPWM